MTSTSPPPTPEAASLHGSLRPAIDPKKLRELEALRPAVRSRVLAAYRRDAPFVMTNIEAALQKHDAAGVRDGAHRLKSSSAAVGAYKLSDLFTALEIEARLGGLDEAPAILAEIQSELPRVLSGLSRVDEA